MFRVVGGGAVAVPVTGLHIAVTILLPSRIIVEVMTGLGDGSITLLFQLVDLFISFRPGQGLIVLYILDLRLVIILYTVDLGR